MKTTTVVIGIVILAIVTIISTGCEKTDPNQFNHTLFPTNHWKVVGFGTNNEVVVETESTNLLVYLRVHKATDVVGVLTNGQPVRVEMVVRVDSLRNKVILVGSKAYSSMD